METRSFDVIVAGLGVFGAATVRAAAGAGSRVLGLDARHPPHTLGSSHGRTRILREAYFEDPRYVGLVRRSLEAWQALESATGRSLFRTTGCLTLGPADSEILVGSLRSARSQDVPHERLDATELRRRYPVARIPEHFEGLLEHRAGVLDAEGGVAALLQAARSEGAVLRSGVALRGWEVQGGDPESVVVETSAGRFRGRTLVLALGPWLGPRLGAGPDGHGYLRVTREVVHWFRAPRGTGQVDATSLPVSLWETWPGLIHYTIPDAGDGFKIGLHHHGRLVDPDGVDRDVHDEEVDRVRGFLRDHLPSANGPLVASSVCLYTTTPDGHFLVGPHPDFRRVVVVGGGSGHGFKFAPVLGEAAARWALDDPPGGDLAFLDPRRLPPPESG
ncbi:MAG: N-methyl-L-tryptophan oxidase [Gemmatimonadota bacterium]